MPNPTVVFTADGEVTVAERDAPDPGRGELLVETTRSLISTGTELALLEGKVQGSWGERPIEAPGYSNVGEVVGVGDGVAADWVGTRVAVQGGHAKYVTAEPGGCRRVPEDVGDPAATFSRLAEITMNGVRRGEVEWGETVAVYGAGLIGQLSTRFARAAGARGVATFDLAPDRLEYLPDDPAVEGADPEARDPESVVGELSRGRLADVVIEATGSAGAIPAEFDVLRRQGRFVLLSSPRETGEFDYYRDWHRPGYELVGAHATTHPETGTAADPWTAKRHGELFFALLGQDRIDVEGLLSHRFDAADAPDAYGLLRENRTEAMGVLLEWA
jgi:2-desacetyl-2-hydroxyethyl bacteriochlorophyllide A dehydrogenase